MFITDKIWEHLLPAVETTNEGMAREDFEKGIQDGNYKLFTNNKSSALTASYNSILRVGLVGVSIQTSLVFSVICSLKEFPSCISTNLNLIP